MVDARAQRQEAVVQTGWSWCRSAVLVAISIVAWGCQGRPSGPVVDSESHWLEQCETSATCGALECVCGVCTVPCDGECGGIETVCAPAPAGCEVPAGGMCTVRCGNDADCGRDHLACIDALCLPIATPAPDDMGPVDMAPPADMAPEPSPDAAPVDATPDMRPLDMRPPDMAPDMGLLDMAPDMSPPDMAPDMAPPVEGECAHPDSACFDDAQCADGICSAALPGGPCVCVAPGPPVARVMCGEGECCDDADCPGVDGRAGRCQGEGLDPQNNACFGEPMRNACVAESCVRDADCGAGKTCIRPGEYGHAISACVDATCATDADCVERDEGQCTPFFTGCFVRGFHCTYLDDVCRVDANCPERGAPKVCLPLDGGGTECREIP